MAEAAEGQRQQYNKHSHEQSFKVVDPVWLSIPTAGKLDPHWVVTVYKSSVNVAISDGPRRRVVHVNRIRHHHQPAVQLHAEDALQENQGGHLQWQAPQVNHDIQRQPEEPPVQIPAEDHVVLTWLRCLAGTLKG